MINSDIKEMVRKNILIALDYHPSAEKVAKEGYEFAKGMNANIIIVHVYAEPAFYAVDYSPIMGYKGAYTDGAKAVVDDIKKEGVAFLEAVASHLGDPAIKTVALSGDTIEKAILDYADNNSIDLIIMGSHARHGIGKLLMPDLSEHMIKHSKIPILIIRTDK